MDREPDERAAFLAETCIDDSGLRREIEELLRYDGAAESFIQGNALAFEARRLEPEELSQTGPQSLPGQSVGAYRILALLGRGGMGVVYRARDERLRRDVAIKVLPASLAHDADRLRRFEQEAHATSALNHPNILTIYDIGAHEEAPFIVAELLAGYWNIDPPFTSISAKAFGPKSSLVCRQLWQSSFPTILPFP